MTPLSDASPLEQMSDQELARQLELLFAFHETKQLIFEAARRLRAAAEEDATAREAVQRLMDTATDERLTLRIVLDTAFHAREMVQAFVDGTLPATMANREDSRAILERLDTVMQIRDELVDDPVRRLHAERPAFLDHVDHTGQPIDPVDALRLSRWMHQATLQALGDVKRELAHYKAGEQPRVEDRDREIAELKQQIKAAPRAQTCETCRFLQRPSVDLPKVWWCGHAKSPLGTRHFTREKIIQLSCIFHVPRGPRPRVS